jgi:hypothetical protein
LVKEKSGSVGKLPRSSLQKPCIQGSETIMPQTLELAPFDVRSIPTPQVFTYIVTLIHRKTGDEQALTIETLTDSFTSVLNEIHWQRAERKLFGYEIFEVLDCNLPF